MTKRNLNHAEKRKRLFDEWPNISAEQSDRWGANVLSKLRKRAEDYSVKPTLMGVTGTRSTLTSDTVIALVPMFEGQYTFAQLKDILLNAELEDASINAALRDLGGVNFNMDAKVPYDGRVFARARLVEMLREGTKLPGPKGRDENGELVELKPGHKFGASSIQRILQLVAEIGLTMEVSAGGKAVDVAVQPELFEIVYEAFEEAAQHDESESLPSLGGLRIASWFLAASLAFGLPATDANAAGSDGSFKEWQFAVSQGTTQLEGGVNKRRSIISEIYTTDNQFVSAQTVGQNLGGLIVASAGPAPRAAAANITEMYREYGIDVDLVPALEPALSNGTVINALKRLKYDGAYSGTLVSLAINLEDTSLSASTTDAGSPKVVPDGAGYLPAALASAQTVGKNLGGLLVARAC